MTRRRRLRGRAPLLFLPLLALLTASDPADYTGPDRTVTQYRWQRRLARYLAVHDPPGPGYDACTLTLYFPPSQSAPSPNDVAPFFNPDPRACGASWPGTCGADLACDISKTLDEVRSCKQGQEGCTAVPYTVTHPPATVSGSVVCDLPGRNGWCRGGARLSVSGSEPLSGESILSLEGARNGEPFACPGAVCEVPLVEGANAFTFWAHSSWGDTSEMGNASGSLDSQPPTVSGQASGVAGLNGWFLSEVTVQATAADPAPGSGVASLQVSLDGGPWAAVSGPLTVTGDGVHTLDLRALDVAGNTATQRLTLAIDGTAPVVSLVAGASAFCPGCGENLDLDLQVDDTASGVATWTLTIGGVTVASGNGPATQRLSWDGSGLSPGAYTLHLAAQDGAGNAAEATLAVDLVAPTATPTPVPPTATPLPPPPTSTPRPASGDGAPSPSRSWPTATVVVVLPSPTAIAAAATPTAQAPAALPAATAPPPPTPTRAVIIFGGPPQAPAEKEPSASVAGPERDVSAAASPAVTTAGGGSGVLWGAAAAALMGAVAAYALRRRRARRLQEARLAAEMARRNALQRAREAAWRRAVAAARRARLAAARVAERHRRWLSWLAVEAAASAEAARRVGNALGADQDDKVSGTAVPTTPTPPDHRPTPQPTPAPERPPTPPPVPEATASPRPVLTPTSEGTPMPTPSAPRWFLDPRDFDRRISLTSLREGETREVPLGRLPGYAEWGLAVSRGLEWPGQAPTGIGPGGLSAGSGPLGADRSFSRPRGSLWINLPGKASLPLPEGGETRFSRGLYLRAEGRGLRTVWTVGYQERWATTPGAESSLPVGKGAVGYYVKVAPVQTLVTIVAVIVTLWAARQSPLWQPQPGVP